jgi:choline dehydrogenase
MIHDPKSIGMISQSPAKSWEAGPSIVPHGKILGGSSAINATIVNRGQDSDYNHVAAARLPWSGASMTCSLFQESEAKISDRDDRRGRSWQHSHHELDEAEPVLRSLYCIREQAGIPYNADYLGNHQFGVAMAQLAAERGKRHSTATSYLAPARWRKNLHIIGGAHVSRLLLEGRKCAGVEFIRQGNLQQVKAGREVIVSCGAINSPNCLNYQGSATRHSFRRSESIASSPAGCR